MVEIQQIRPIETYTPNGPIRPTGDWLDPAESQKVLEAKEVEVLVRAPDVGGADVCILRVKGQDGTTHDYSAFTR